MSFKVLQTVNKSISDLLTALEDIGMDSSKAKLVVDLEVESLEDGKLSKIKVSI